jgi:hypothetical protein
VCCACDSTHTKKGSVSLLPPRGQCSLLSTCSSNTIRISAFLVGASALRAPVASTGLFSRLFGTTMASADKYPVPSSYPVTKSADEWKQKLNKQEYDVLFKKDTERAGTGQCLVCRFCALAAYTRLLVLARKVSASKHVLNLYFCYLLQANMIDSTLRKAKATSHAR